jgi:hypothetical protein
MLVYYYSKYRRLTPLKKIIINFLKGIFALNASKSSQNQAKKGAYKKILKSLLPYGMLATKTWLRMHGLSSHAIDNAVKSETLLLLASGVYSQYNRNLRWEGVVASLQRMELDDINDELTVPPTHAGGVTALALSGLSQYLSLGSSPTTHLYSRNKLPAWLDRTSLSFKFEGHGVKTLWSNELMQDDRFIKQHEWEKDLPDVYFSCPEKAIFEVLKDVPDAISFEHADELMQGLVNLSPKKLDQLLTGCRSIKVKRLFFWFAKRQNYQWFKKLDRSKYDLGAGKRVVAKDGKLDKEFLITVPRHMAKNDE